MNRLRNILLCICAILYSTAVYSQVVINQIMYDTPYNEQIAIGEAYSNGEFVELYNVGDTAVFPIRLDTLRRRENRDLCI